MTHVSNRSAFGTLARHGARAEYRNPVFPNGADPGTLRVGKDYFVTTTGGGPGGAFSIRESTDLVHWKDTGNSIFTAATLPKWADPHGQFWAPEIHQLGPGRFVAYYTAQNAKDGKLCVGCATASSPLGPFTDTRGSPLAEAPRVGGAIDPSFFRDKNGTHYLLWKENGNGVKPNPFTHKHVPSRIMMMKLDASGTGPAAHAKAKPLIRNDQRWEGRVVEAPEMVKHGRFYYLFYSGGCFANRTYAEGVARSTSPMGPFEKRPGQYPGRILHSGDGWVGPGHGEPVRDQNGKDWFVYHARRPTPAGGTAPPRQLMLDRIRWVNGWPVINNGEPSRRWKPAPP